MTKAYASTIIKKPVDHVWHIIRDFGTIGSWHPVVRNSHIEHNQPGDLVGCIRSLHLQDGGLVRETLLALSDYDYCIEYDILESPMPLKNYHAKLCLHPITDSNETFAEWSATFDCQAEDRDTLIERIGQQVFKVGLDNLEKMGK